MDVTTANATPLERTSRIVRDQAVLDGEPVIRGTRISVRSVILAAREYGGVAGVLQAYPQLDADSIEQALTFYRHYSGEIERSIREHDAKD